MIIQFDFLLGGYRSEKKRHQEVAEEAGRLERVSWRTDVDVSVAESSESSRHECVS